MTFPFVNTGELPTTTIVPESEDLYFPYFNRTYEDIASVVNQKDSKFFPISISDSPQNIPNVPNFGAYLVMVSGSISTLPTKTVSLCKADATAAGVVTPIGSQAGTGAWAGNLILVTSTARNFQIAHDRAGVTATFNIRIVGTQ